MRHQELDDTEMTRAEMSNLITHIQDLMTNNMWSDIMTLLQDTEHNDGEYALTLLRSSYVKRDNYFFSWYKQLEYAKTLFDNPKETLVGLI